MVQMYGNNFIYQHLGLKIKWTRFGISAQFISKIWTLLKKVLVLISRTKWNLDRPTKWRSLSAVSFSPCFSFDISSIKCWQFKNGNITNSSTVSVHNWLVISKLKWGVRLMSWCQRHLNVSHQHGERICHQPDFVIIYQSTLHKSCPRAQGELEGGRNFKSCGK